MTLKFAILLILVDFKALKYSFWSEKSGKTLDRLCILGYFTPENLFFGQKTGKILATKTYELKPCIVCGGEVEKPSESYYAPKIRCSTCDRKHKNARKTKLEREKRLADRAANPVRCTVCHNPLAPDVRPNRRVCDSCKTSAVDERIRLREAIACRICGGPTVQNLKSSKPNEYCPECAEVAARGNRRKAKNKILYDDTFMGSCYRHARKRANRNNIPFNIELEDVAMPEVCPVLGVPMLPAAICGSNPHMPSIDRHVPSLGYVKGNVAVISFRANTIKGDATFDEIEKLYLYMKSIQCPDDR